MGKTGRIILYSFLAIVALFILFIANSFFGNPISKNMAKNAAIEYVEEHYKGEGFELERVFYSFKSSDYIAEFRVPGSLDRHFRLCLNKSGKVEIDTYENIADLTCTKCRLSREYSDFINPYIDKIAYTYGNESFMVSELMFLESIDEDKFYNKRRMKISDLEIDKKYNLKKLSAEIGSLSDHIYSDDVSASKASEIVLKIKKDLADEGISFQEIYLSLSEPFIDGDKKVSVTKELTFVISRKDICDDKKELERRVQKLIDEQYDYFYSPKED